VSHRRRVSRAPAVAQDRARQQARRRFLQFLLGSPLLPAALWPGASSARPGLAIPATLDEALDVFQIEAAARGKLDQWAWHFIAGGADDLRTVAANRAAFDAWQIRARRLVDVSRVDTRLTLFGTDLHSPILLAPVGAQGTIHPAAERASMAGASARGHLMLASTVADFSIGDIRAAGTAPLWFQLYPSRDLGLMTHLLAKAKAAGATAVAVTVDSPVLGNREAERWFARGRQPATGPRLGNFKGYRGPMRLGDPSLTWTLLEELRRITPLPLVLKGIVTAEDATLARRHGADGLIVSNHGGRQEDSGRGTLECLPEIVAAVDGRMPVLIDGGFRRGTDIFKALALGATAVCVGRPYLYGLGAWGSDGVAKVLAMLDAELIRIMQFAGTVSLAAVSRGSVVESRRR
jgi:4-hydroxymandelate oxidase